MTLHDAQAQHTLAVAKLISWSYAEGYELTWGEAFRTQEQAQWDATHHVGIVHSVHCERLAVDLMLFKDKVYLTKPEEYKPLGEFWKTLHLLARWGGDFSTGDADHFSFEWEGIS